MDTLRDRQIDRLRRDPRFYTNPTSRTSYIYPVISLVRFPRQEHETKCLYSLDDNGK